jgi:heme/copper-type cytochrome/quinol oxidase subunit 1
MHRPLRRRLIAVFTLGAVLLIVGISLFARNGLTGQPVGWVAYAPLTNTPLGNDAPGRLVLMQSGSWWGLALTGVGALAVSGALGYALASRHRKSPATD